MESSEIGAFSGRRFLDLLETDGRAVEARDFGRSTLCNASAASRAEANRS